VTRDVKSSPERCVFRDVYVRVFEHARAVLHEHGDGEELRQVEAKLDALAGASRLAAALAACDAHGRGPLRDIHEICRAICDEPCEMHPRWGTPSKR
jgi:hypothetical protein